MTKQMQADRKAHLRELEEWKDRARRSPLGRYPLGGDCFIVYTRQNYRVPTG